jgi:hypothetical protein
VPRRRSSPRQARRLEALAPHRPQPAAVARTGGWSAGGGGGGGGGRGRGNQPCTPNADGTFNSGFGEVAGNPNCLPPMKQWAQDLKKKRMANNMKDNPDVWCLPIGLMQYHNHPQPSQIVQTKNLMLITYESNYGLRYIYTDGRPAPDNDPQPWWFGYFARAVGRQRHAGRRDHALQLGRAGGVARRQRHTVVRCAEDDGTLSASDLRIASDRRDD